MAGFAGGALWAFIPGYFYAYRGTNILITTILLNEIAIGILATLVNGPLKEPPGFYAQSAVIAPTAQLPLILSRTPLHAGFLLAILLAVGTYVLIFRTPLGFDIRAIGENPTAAKHSGIRVIGIQILCMLLAGGMAGLAGATEILGTQYRLRAGRGYMALACVILGQWNPWGVALGGLIFGAGNALQMRLQSFGLPIATNLILTLPMVIALIVVLMAKGSALARPMSLAKPYYKE